MKHPHLGNTSCGFVWSGVSTDTMGRLRPCCTINSPLTDDTGEPYRIDRVGDFERFWKSSTMQEIRKAGLENKWHKLCFKCQEQEEGGSSSQRMIYNYLLPKNIDTIPKIKVFNLLLSNKCNMKCRMCSPKNSHLIGRESKTHGLESLWGNDVWGKDQTSTYSEPVSIDDDAIVELVEAYHESLEEIQFAGGEPFLSDTQYMILKKLVDLGVSNKIKISYNTNGTIPMEQYYDLWKKFKTVSLSVSLDAADELANYIRYPTNWGNINRVMRSLNSFSSETVHVKVHCLVQALNVLRLDDFMTWLYQYENISRVPSFSALVLPKHHHIRNIPLTLRKESATKLKNFMLNNSFDNDKKRIACSYQWQIDRMKRIIHFIENEPDADSTDDFIKFNKALDKVRGLDLFTILPELNGYYKI